MQVIGADTLDEYRRYVEADKALERRFHPILVREPSIEDSLRIMEGLAPRYEKHHKVQYEHEALEAAVKFSERYITDRRLPDKAVDLLDEAGSRKHIRLISIPHDIKELERQHQKLQRDKTAAFNALQFLMLAGGALANGDIENRRTFKSRQAEMGNRQRQSGLFGVG